MIYELEGVPESVARRALQLGASKLPLPCLFVHRDRSGCSKGVRL